MCVCVIFALAVRNIVGVLMLTQPILAIRRSAAAQGAPVIRKLKKSPLGQSLTPFTKLSLSFSSFLNFSKNPAPCPDSHPLLSQTSGADKREAPRPVYLKSDGKGIICRPVCADISSRNNWVYF